MKHLRYAAIALFAVSLACSGNRIGTPAPAANSGAAPQGSLRVSWEYSTAPFPPLSVADDGLGRPYLYVAQQDGGLLILDISDSKQASKAAVMSKRELLDWRSCT